ncbi:GH32 C-terminal domain-containing protein [Niabella beijingensis]|uniref:GH32 C-terminal domain-containing protein n=1 Tax=Niabella beijingensis TaxID=2872700 RepID=UPI001CBF299B|nr:GH32 C-terminal domain-containing protein [Niabella beijingensis]MBZ4190920.1 glycoside hydrolase family 32 protein [Niabella beijingensis]
MIKRWLQPCLFLLVFLSANGQEQPQTKNISTYFTADKKYLVLPVKNDAPKRNLELWIDGVNTRFWDMELAEGLPDWYAYMRIDQWKGKAIELRVDKVAASSTIFNPVLQSDKDSNTNEYREKLRPQFHFSPKRGWTNDPNGMVYFNGEYHLFFQHNPYGRNWGNMTWGHAVSKDLIHWNELDDAIHPDQGGPVFSGGAVVDKNNTSGLGENGKPAMVLFHTGARGWGQYMSWSTDGRRFRNYGKAVVPRINKDNRDPKVIWYEPTKKWIMVVWVERGNNEQHSMQFLTSPDLKNWTPASITYGGAGNDRYLFECPEFYELPVQGMNGVKKWVLTGANTQYAIGSFDGTRFTEEEKRLQNQYGRDFYAPQTFSDEPSGRRIEIGWWRTNTVKDQMPFNQSMSLPMEHRLVKTPDGIRLTRMPVKELEQLRIKAYKQGNSTLKEMGPDPLKDIAVELAEIRMELAPGKAKEIRLNVRGVPLIYDVTRQELVADGVKAPAALQNGKLSLLVYADRTGLEVFVNNGLVFMPVNINIDGSNRSLSLSAKGGSAKVSGLEVYELKSIWE